MQTLISSSDTEIKGITGSILVLIIAICCLTCSIKFLIEYI